MPSENLTDRLAHITARQDALQTVVEQQHVILAALVAADPPGLIPQLLTKLESVDGHAAQLELDTIAIRSSAASTASLLFNLLAITTDRVAPGVENTFGAMQDVGNILLATACPCASDAPALAPPLAGGTTEPSGEHCQRVQYLLDKLIETLGRVADMLTAGASMTSALAAACLGAGIIPGVDVASIPAGVVAGFVSLIGLAGAGRLLQLKTWLTDNYTGLQNLLYSSTSPTAAQAAWYAYVDAHDPAPLDPTVKLSLKVFAWSGLLNALYDPTGAVWDVSAYDDTACSLVFVGFPDSFDVPWAGTNCSGSDYGIGPWPARPYYTRSTGYCGTNNMITPDEDIDVRVEAFDVSGNALQWSVNGGGSYTQHFGLVAGYSTTIRVNAGQTLTLLGGNGAVSIHVLITAAA